MFVLICALTTISLPIDSKAGTIPGNRALKILFIGNSLTMHQPKPEIGWSGYWGMAASQPDKDYVHRVQLGLTAATGQIPEIKIISGDITYLPLLLEDDITLFDPAVIVIQVGNNAPGDTEPAVFIDGFSRIRRAAPAARIITVGMWSTTRADQREAAIVTASKVISADYVYIGEIQDRAASFSDSAVAWHPSDTGMQRIADRILHLIVFRNFLPEILTCSQHAATAGGRWHSYAKDHRFYVKNDCDLADRVGRPGKYDRQLIQRI